MHDNIRTKCKGTAEYRSGKSVVHYQRHAVSVGFLSEHLNIRHYQRRVRKSLSKHAAGVGTADDREQRADAELVVYLARMSERQFGV